MRPRPLRVRPAAVAGAFYPDRPDDLRHELEASFAGAVEVDGAEGVPKAIVVPHAGYVYSGPVAASGYARLAPARGRIRRVVLLGPAHRVWVDGMAVPSVDAFDTPLGAVTVDAERRRLVLTHPSVVESDGPHALEHSLEVHLPFLMATLGDDIEVLPIVVGGAPAAAVAEVLDLVWGGDETVIVVSSDLSHYEDYDTAVRLDRATAAAIETGDAELIGDRDACGAYPLRGLLIAARRRGLHVRTVDLRNSGDTAGPRDRVVGYGAFLVS